ncbi:MAG: IclR family transcriptional regulator [Dehalococcoidia bacterium]
MATATSSTVVKAFQVLRLFRAHPLLGAGECARILGMPRASAHRMLVSLKKAGALEVTPRGQYRLTLQMFEIGHHVPRQRWLFEAAYLPMEELVTKTGLSAHLAVRDGLELVYIVKLRHAPDRTRARAGERNWLHATALGKVLLAHAPEEIVGELVQQGVFPCTPHTIVTRQQLYRQLERARSEGFAYDFEERTIGLVSIAVPVCDPRGHVVASLSVLAPAEKYRPRLDQFKPVLSGTRRQIEQQLRRPDRPESLLARVDA